MIISHKYKFIFIKTEKTAGTSIEIALSKYCGDDDIITPISPIDEKKREELGYRGAQNYFIPIDKYSLIDYLKVIYKRKARRFYNHAPASYVKAYVSPEVWNTYYKFCFERNPWDKVVSWYYWIHKNKTPPPISEFVHSSKAEDIRGFDLYTIDSKVAVDKVYRYEELNDAMKDISERLGLPEVPSLPNAKSQFRVDKRSYHEILTEADIDQIQKVYAREIAYFGYSR